MAKESQATRGIGIELRFDAAARAVIADNTPSAGAAPIDEAWLRQRLADGGWGELRFLENAATRLLSSYNQGIPVQSLPIAEIADASFSVTIIPNGMAVYLDMTPAQGGTRVTVKEILERLVELGVHEGVVDHAAIDGAVAEGTATGLLIAHGIEAEHGKDGYLEAVFPKLRNRSPLIDEHGQVDYRELSEIVVVKPGDALQRRHEPTLGVAGRTVRGEVLAARPGKPVKFGRKSKGVVVSPDDPDLLVAEISGQPVVEGDSISVEPVFTAKAVTTESGNIHFDGTVVVKGDVAAGMTVQATGDIVIDGVAEIATLDAGGSIVVKGGVIGKPGRRGSDEHPIRCGGSFEAGYAHNARIEAGDSIIIDDTAMQCELIAINHIVVGRKKQGHGCIIGGNHQATLSITAKVIGSPQRVATNFEVGLSPLLRRHLRELAKRIESINGQLFTIKKLTELAEKFPERIAPDKLEQALRTDAALSEEVAAAKAEHDELERKIEFAKCARVVATESLHEGVEVRVGLRKYRVSHFYAGAAVALDEEGQLGIHVIEDGAAPSSVKTKTADSAD